MSDSVLQRFGSFEMMAARYQDWQADFAESVQGGAVSFGNFDGVHLGHQALVEALVSHARKVHRPAVAILFDPHPRFLLEKGLDLKLLTTTEDRAILLKRQGLDEVIALQVDRQFLNLDAHSFFQRYFQFGFRPQWIVEGSNFHFGKQRTGDVHLLKKLAADSGIQVQIVPPVTHLDSEVSSSRIREALEKGDVGLANTLLGRPYFLRGKVQAGFKRGQTLGFPTANLGEIQTVIPMAG
ncbi:MAG: riboflavin kinase, partial [Gemmataceae bacterium]